MKYMQLILALSFTLMANQANALNFGVYYQDGKRVISNVPTRCIKNNVLVCSPTTLASNSDKNLKSLKKISHKNPIKIKVTEPRPSLEEKANIIAKLAPAKPTIKEKIRPIKKKVITKHKVTIPIINEVIAKPKVIKSVPVKKVVAPKIIKQIVIATPAPATTQLAKIMTDNGKIEPTLLPLSTTYKSVETYVKSSEKSSESIIFTGCEQAYFTNDGWQTQCRWIKENKTYISSNHSSWFTIVNDKVTASNLIR